MSDNADLTALRREVAELREDVKGLIEAWNTAKGLVKFVKFLAFVATATASLLGVWRIGKS